MPFDEDMNRRSGGGGGPDPRHDPEKMQATADLVNEIIDTSCGALGICRDCLWAGLMFEWVEKLANREKAANERRKNDNAG